MHPSFVKSHFTFSLKNSLQSFLQAGLYGRSITQSMLFCNLFPFNIWSSSPKFKEASRYCCVLCLNQFDQFDGLRDNDKKNKWSDHVLKNNSLLLCVINILKFSKRHHSYISWGFCFRNFKQTTIWFFDMSWLPIFLSYRGNSFRNYLKTKTKTGQK